jgi:hypothetical protein
MALLLCGAAQRVRFLLLPAQQAQLAHLVRPAQLVHRVRPERLAQQELPLRYRAQLAQQAHLLLAQLVQPVRQLGPLLRFICL